MLKMYRLHFYVKYMLSHNFSYNTNLKKMLCVITTLIEFQIFTKFVKITNYFANIYDDRPFPLRIVYNDLLLNSLTQSLQ